MTHPMANSKIKRARFISKSVEIREQLASANPDQILKAVQVYCSDAYWSMLWQLDSEASEQFFKSWNTCVKLVHDIPRNQVLSRYPSFFQKLLSSPSKEVRLLSNIVSWDLHSVTAKNLKYISDLTKLSPWDFASTKIKQELPVKNVPEEES